MAMLTVDLDIIFALEIPKALLDILKEAFLLRKQNYIYQKPVSLQRPYRQSMFGDLLQINKSQSILGLSVPTAVSVLVAYFSAEMHICNRRTKRFV